MKPVVTTPFKTHINLTLLPKPQRSSSLPSIIPIRCMKPPTPLSTSTSITTSNAHHTHLTIEHPQAEPRRNYEERASRVVTVGAISALGFVLVMMGVDDHYNNAAMAMGLPEGPLMAEFWDNVRRYALYAVTVSTGALYTILFQPIVELLKNPVSAVLLLLVLGATIYIVSQVLYAMVGVSDFSYDYSY